MIKKQKQLTLSNQTFSNIREKSANWIYVDKTEHIYNLVTTWMSQKIFLSRPRRFGKSLLCSTFKSLFKWEKEYFYDTYIEDKWNWEEKYPVIHIMFGTWVVTDKEYLQAQLKDIIESNIRWNNIKSEEIVGKTIWGRFQNLIEYLYIKTWKKVVIIIDEYDKPILDRIHKIEKALEIREELKSFYSAIKNSDEYLRFVFITGVSKFSQVSLFSGLNQLQDITFNPDYATLCWYTIEEIKKYYWSEWYLDWVNLKELKKWYNWYNFNCKTDEEKVYNPFGILNFFWNNNEYINYWFKSATPTFLINLLKKNNYPIINFESIKVNQKVMDAFEIENLNIETLMFQTWYLTIKNKETFGSFKEYTLWMPNLEVKQSLCEYIIEDYFLFKDLTQNFLKVKSIYLSLRDWNIENLIETIKSIFAWIPYNNYVNNDIAKYEWFYSGIIYSFLQAAWIDFTAEDTTNKWRIDFTLKCEKFIYIIELKVEQTWEEAFKQIKDKKYEEKYLTENKDIFLIWINFSEEKRNVESWKFEKVKK